MMPGLRVAGYEPTPISVVVLAFLFRFLVVASGSEPVRTLVAGSHREW